MTDQYVPGACNIGPAEIAIRRRVGHVGLAVTAALATALLRSNLPRAWRLTLALPAAGAASGYLQARQQFCANYGFRGLTTSTPAATSNPSQPQRPSPKTAAEPARSPPPHWRSEPGSRWPPPSSRGDDGTRTPRPLTVGSSHPS